MHVTDALPLVAVPTPAYYEAAAGRLLTACRCIDADSILHVQKFHPNAEKLINLNKPDTNFDIEDARLILAREHGFADWEKFKAHLHALCDPTSAVTRFEQAVDAIVTGDAPALSALLQADPQLVHLHSGRAHEAKLLHYIAANGVENFRQRVPPNAVDMAQILLAAGASPLDKSLIYDGKPGTVLELLVSSIHPANAGVQGQLTNLLLDYGAPLEGADGDGTPLLTALCCRFPVAAETLAARGAQVNSIVTAATLGEVDKVASFYNSDGTLRNDIPRVKADWLTIEDTPQANADLAFVWAAMHNRMEVVRFFLEKGMHPGAQDHRGWTALHWTAYYGYPALTRLLLDHKAPTEAHNEFGGTVLDQTLWATTHNGVREAHFEIIRMLLQAKAKVHIWWLLSDLNPPLDARIAEILVAFSR